MDAQQDVPRFKLAKVGRRRKAAVAGLLGLFGGGGSSAGGVAGFLGSIGGKVMVTLLMGTLGVGAYNVGKVIAPPQARQAKVAVKPQPFAAELAQKGKEEAVQQPIQSARAQSGLGMVSGSLDGLTPAEREAQAKAAAEAQAKADAEAKAKEEEQAKASPQMDPGAMMAAMAGKEKKDKDKEFARKFGNLSKSVGTGSLAGGAGLSGGMGRGFDMPLQGGAGKLAAMGSYRTRSVSAASPRSVVAGSRGRRAFNQAVKAGQYSKQATMSKAEAGASKAYQAFNGETAAGTSGGAGITSGSALTGTGETATSVNPVGAGNISGGTDTGPDDCAALFPDGTYTPSASGGCVKIPGASVDPTDTYFKWLGIIAMTSGILIMIASALSLWVYTKPYAMYIAWVVAALGAIEALLGIILISMGRTIEGSIFTGLGAVTGVCAYLAASSGINNYITQEYGWYAVAAGLAQACASGLANNTSSGRYDADSKSWKYD